MRKHKIGRARALWVLEHAYGAVPRRRDGPRGWFVMVVGDDMTGRALEVGIVVDDGVLWVIHVMDLRPKFRPIYEEGKERWHGTTS